MLQILQSTGDLLWGLVGSIWGVVCLVAAWGWDVLYLLHTEAPRLEGLLVGILLAWVLLRRDKHPLLRVLSAPLKLVVDILDLAWDQVCEVADDAWWTVKGVTLGVLDWAKSRVAGAWGWLIGRLKAVRDGLSRKKEDAE